MTAKFQAEVKAEQIRALSHLAAQEDVRYYLKGVMLIASPQVLLVATTGALLGCLQTDRIASAQFEILIPSATIKAMGTAKGPVIVGSDDGISWTLKTAALSLSWKADGGVFPDFRRAIPATTTGESAQFDARQTVLFWKSAKELGATKAGQHSVLLSPNGQAAALVTFPAEPMFAGLLSPLIVGAKFPEAPTSAPAWAKHAPYVPSNWAARQSDAACDLA